MGLNKPHPQSVVNYDLRGFYREGAEEREIRNQELAKRKSAKEEALRWFSEDCVAT